MRDIRHGEDPVSAVCSSAEGPFGHLPNLIFILLANVENIQTLKVLRADWRGVLSSKLEVDQAFRRNEKQKQVE